METEYFWELVEQENLHKYKKVFLDNGFQDWDTVEELTPEILKNMNSVEDIDKILDIKNRVSLEKIKSLSFIDGSQENLEKQPETQISIFTLLKRALPKRKKHHNPEQYFESLVSLDLSGQQISRFCFEFDTILLSNLMILNLKNNNFYSLEDLEILHNLRELNVSYNKLQSTQGLSKLVKLEYLNMDGNELEMVDNLENLEKLKDLSISNQFPNQGDKPPLQFETFSMKNLNQLIHLDVSNNNLQSLSDLSFLKKLQTLDLSKTNIMQIEIVAQALPFLDSLKKINLLETELAKSKSFFKDIIFLGGANLEKINGKKISLFQKQFVQKLKQFKQLFQSYK